ncbi:suppressor of cytokine signaling 2-like [Oscarella lobularis]|uniref:suppressor of cytokine signaling 2-like n=1 Tax=Oscarella lobularis TaxID=121494 RepID=UPI003313DA51
MEELPHERRRLHHRWSTSSVNPERALVLASNPTSSSFGQKICLNRVLRTLKQSGWYWRSLSNADSQRLLIDAEDGTFLLRDSADERHLFTLSFKVEGIVSSVRLELYRGLFRLYSSDCGASPAFDCVVGLVNFYIRNDVRLFWLERDDGPRISVKIRQPLLTGVPTLQHFCRSAINASTKRDHVEKLPLPSKLKDYVSDYPY